jgi:hypothetical protein
MIVILSQIVFFCHLELESIVRAFLDLVEIIWHSVARSLEIGAGTKSRNDDYEEEKLFHEACEITVFT